MKIVMTFSDIVYKSSWYKYRILRNNFFNYLVYYNELFYLTEENINNRPYKNLISKEKTMKEFMGSVYLDYEYNRDLKNGIIDFDETYFTKLFTSILNSESLLISSQFDELIILCNESEYEFCNRVIMKEKIRPIKASDYNILEDNWNVMISDDLNIIVNVCKKLNDLKEKEFLIPNRPYCKLEGKDELLIMEKGGKITYY